MHLSISEGKSLVQALKVAGCGQTDHTTGVEAAVFPVATALTAVVEAASGSGIRVGAQNMHHEAKGAFTGELSPLHLKDAGCTHVLLGHSERRQHFGETDAALAKKLRAAFAHGLIPVLCVGETLDEREDNKTFEVLKRQLAVLEGLAPSAVTTMVIAYEPVWAIGTGRNATPSQAQEAHKFIRNRVAAYFDVGTAQAVRILYGGSVKADNIDALMSEPDLDGALVGGASLDAKAFSRIVGFQPAAKKV